MSGDEKRFKHTRGVSMAAISTASWQEVHSKSKIEQKLGIFILFN